MYPQNPFRTFSGSFIAGILNSKDTGKNAKKKHVFYLREEPLMIWGGSGKSGKKTSTATRPGKKIQINNLEEKKLNSTTWMEKKFIMDFMLGCDSLNMKIHGFNILFRYK